MFAYCFLCGPPTLNKITLFSLWHSRPQVDFHSVRFHDFIAPLGDLIQANLKLVRYMPLDRAFSYLHSDIEVYYHRNTHVDGEWWLSVAKDERDRIFAEGGTPRIVPVGDWD